MFFIYLASDCVCLSQVYIDTRRDVEQQPVCGAIGGQQRVRCRNLESSTAWLPRHLYPARQTAVLLCTVVAIFMLLLCSSLLSLRGREQGGGWISSGKRGRRRAIKTATYGLTTSSGGEHHTNGVALLFRCHAPPRQKLVLHSTAVQPRCYTFSATQLFPSVRTLQPVRPWKHYMPCNG